MKRKSTLFLVTAAAVALVQAALAQSPHDDGAGPPPDPAMVELGARLWTGKATCSGCHGPLGERPIAASLRDSALHLDEMVLAIRCGLPGTQMPAFELGATTSGRCPAGATPPAAASPTLSNREATALASFILATFVGGDDPSPEDCAELWAEAAPAVCSALAPVVR